MGSYDWITHHSDSIMWQRLSGVGWDVVQLEGHQSGMSSPQPLEGIEVMVITRVVVLAGFHELP